MNNLPNKICGNCNKKGHVYKECRSPVISIGILAFRKKRCDKLTQNLKGILGDNIDTKREDRMKVLLVQRKDTMGYIDLLRGRNYNKMLGVYLSEMTNQELMMARTKNFDYLWEKLWLGSSNKYSKDKQESKKKFDGLDKEIFNIKSEWDFTEFGIPKGRKNNGERNLNCAKREFEEETGYSSKDYYIVENFGTIEENFKGSNGIYYTHIYFIAIVRDEAGDPVFDEENPHQVNEIKSLGWFTEKESLSLIRYYDTEKVKVLKKGFCVFNMMNTRKFSDIRNYLRN